MSDSEDDGDSENFESADENLSENDEETKDRGKCRIPPAPEPDKTTRYRKRPERTTSSPAGNTNTEKNSTVLIGSAKPEVFFKDVAGHISKNIDKSLDGLFKTSSTIKDAVSGVFQNADVEPAGTERLNLFDEPEARDDEEPVSSPAKESSPLRLDSAGTEVFPKDVADHVSESVDGGSDGKLKISPSIKNAVPVAFQSPEIENSKSSDEAKTVREDENSDASESLSQEKKEFPNESEPQPQPPDVDPTEKEDEEENRTEGFAESVRKEESTLSENASVRTDPEREREPEPVLESTEGWDDFDFDEDEAVVLSQTPEDPPIRRSPSKEELRSSPNPDPVRQDSSWSWGVGSLLDTATAVTRGISTALETGLGVPDPETLARGTKSDSDLPAPKETEGRSGFPNFGITGLVAGVTSKIVERTKVQEIGSKVISGGLDTLENIGKKTMQVLQEGDPGLKKKRALILGNDKPVLSRILREAKDKAEMEDRILAEKQAERCSRFETLFDDFQGLVHLEALEMLSRQSELKLEQLRASSTEEEKQDLEGILEEVKELCDIEESDFAPDGAPFKIAVEEAVDPLKAEVSTSAIVRIHEEAEDWLTKSRTENPGPKAIYRKAMSAMAELTAAAAHQFHKAGELLSVKERRKTVEEAEALMQLTKILCSEVEALSKKFSERLQEEEKQGEGVRNIKSESENAVSYIKQAFNLLIPVLQLGAT